MITFRSAKWADVLLISISVRLRIRFFFLKRAPSWSEVESMLLSLLRNSTPSIFTLHKCLYEIGAHLSGVKWESFLLSSSWATLIAYKPLIWSQAAGELLYFIDN